MIEAIRYNITRLFDFSGREGRRLFWFWALLVIVVNFIVNIGVSASVTAGAVGSAMNAGAGADPAAVEAAVMQQVIDAAPMMVQVGLVLGIANVVLLGAAFVRRLHDAGFTGLIALIPLAAMVVSTWLAFRQIDDLERIMREAMQAGADGGAAALQSSAGWQALIGWIPLICLVGFGILKSQPAANKWGEPAAG